MTVAPLFCAKFITIDPGHMHHHEDDHTPNTGMQEKGRFRVFKVVIDKFNLGFQKLQNDMKRRSPTAWDVRYLSLRRDR